MNDLELAAAFRALAAMVRKDGKEPTSYDLSEILRHEQQALAHEKANEAYKRACEFDALNLAHVKEDHARRELEQQQTQDHRLRWETVQREHLQAMQEISRQGYREVAEAIVSLGEIVKPLFQPQFIMHGGQPTLRMPNGRQVDLYPLDGPSPLEHQERGMCLCDACTTGVEPSGPASGQQVTGDKQE